jgi:hypothetical protein
LATTDSVVERLLVVGRDLWPRRARWYVARSNYNTEQHRQAKPSSYSRYSRRKSKQEGSISPNKEGLRTNLLANLLQSCGLLTLFHPLSRSGVTQAPSLLLPSKNPYYDRTHANVAARSQSRRCALPDDIMPCHAIAMHQTTLLSITKHSFCGAQSFKKTSHSYSNIVSNAVA